MAAVVVVVTVKVVVVTVMVVVDFVLLQRRRKWMMMLLGRAGEGARHWNWTTTIGRALLCLARGQVRRGHNHPLLLLCQMKAEGREGGREGKDENEGLIGKG